MKSLQSQINEAFSETIVEYFSYRISNAQELIDGLKEIDAPIELTTNGKNVIVIDSKRFKISDKIKSDTMSSISFDDKIYSALHDNVELSKMWKLVNAKYTSILKNAQSIANATLSLNHTNWGTTGPAEINKYFQKISEIQVSMKNLIANKEAQDALRAYEVLRHLYDRGYSNLVK